LNIGRSGGTQRLPQLIGKGHRALQLILCGEMISAQEAASNAPAAIKFTLDAINKGMETSLGSIYLDRSEAQP
jgi:hypothetical protein